MPVDQSVKSESFPDYTSSTANILDIIDFYNINKTDKEPLFPPELPVRARSLSDLSFPYLKNEEKEGKQTFHQTHVALSHGKEEIFKLNDINSIKSELESLFCAVYGLYAPKKVPKSRPIYLFNPTENAWQPIGITSRKINFHSNFEDPLAKDYLIIHPIKKNINDQRKKVIAALNEFNSALDKDKDNAQNQSFFSNIYKRVNNNVNWAQGKVLGTPTAAHIKEEIKYFLKENTQFEIEHLSNLQTLLKNRSVHVNDKLNNDTTQPFLKTLYSTELHAIKTSQETISELLKLTSAYKVDIKIFEEIDKYAEENPDKINLTNEDESICRTIDGEEYQMSVRTLKNYRRKKGLAEGLISSYFNAEIDLHTGNGDNEGNRIDFDKSERNFALQCEDEGWFVGLLNNLLGLNGSFIISQNDLFNFPDLKDADLGYWPAKATWMAKSGLNPLLSYFNVKCNFIKNSFSTEHVRVYKELAKDPIFIFHKFKTLLKIILIPKLAYQYIGELNIRSTEEGKKIIQGFMEYKASRVQDLYEKLIKMPAFQEFIKENGDYVFSLLKEEFTKYKDSLTSKIAKHQDKVNKATNAEEINIAEEKLIKIKQSYQPLIETFNLQEITDAYKKIEKKVKDYQLSTTHTDYSIQQIPEEEIRPTFSL